MPVADMKWIEELEDELDRKAIEKGRKERHKGVPWEKIKADLGLKP